MDCLKLHVNKKWTQLCSTFSFLFPDNVQFFSILLSVDFTPLSTGTPITGSIDLFFVYDGFIWSSDLYWMIDCTQLIICIIIH